jgi:hypothetical protein
MRARTTMASNRHRPLCECAVPERRLPRHATLGSAARLLACVVAVGAELAGATSALAQSPDGSGSAHGIASEVKAPPPELFPPRGLRFGAELTAGRPFFRGDAATIWNAIGSFGIIVPGLDLRLGYDFGRLGLTLSGEVSEFDVGDRDGYGLAVAALLHWRPPLSIVGRYGSRVTAGFIRQLHAGIYFAPGQFPTHVTETAGPADAGKAHTLGDGVRFGFGVEAPGRLWYIRLSAEASVDVVTFREVGLGEGTYRVRNPGWSFYPRLAVALESWPFSR